MSKLQKYLAISALQLLVIGLALVSYNISIHVIGIGPGPAAIISALVWSRSYSEIPDIFE